MGFHVPEEQLLLKGGMNQKVTTLTVNTSSQVTGPLSSGYKHVGIGGIFSKLLSRIKLMWSSQTILPSWKAFVHNVAP